MAYAHCPFDAAAYGTFGHASIAVTRLVDTPGTASTANGRQRFDFGQVGGNSGTG